MRLEFTSDVMICCDILAKSFIVTTLTNNSHMVDFIVISQVIFCFEFCRTFIALKLLSICLNFQSFYTMAVVLPF